jgi:hypothetical protein
MKTAIQEQMPAWYFASYGKPLEKRQVDQAFSWVHRAKRVTRRNAEREFEGRGFEVVYQELGFGGVRFRAKLDIRGKTLYIDPGSEADLLFELDALGFPLAPTPKALIMAHELFHLFCPRCPSGIAELAAHLYCADVLDLDYFPGLLDLVPKSPPVFSDVISA